MALEPGLELRAAAIGWHVRLRAERAEDWDAFVEWLAENPAHSDAYDAVVLADADLEPAMAAWSAKPSAANDDGAEEGWFKGRRRWFGGVGAVAAALVVAVIASPFLKTSHYDVATAPGEQRILQLDGGSRIALNGATRVMLDKNNPRFAALDEGEATFVIEHDPKRPFTLELGADRVQNVGTLFNVIRDKDGQTIEVAEGAVLYNPGREAILLEAGQTLSDRAGASRITVSRKDAATIAAWRRGRLAYRGTPLSEVAVDLARNLGTPVVVAKSIAGRRFSGTIQIDRNQDRMFARLAAVLEVDARRTERGWMIGPRVRAAR